MDTQGVQGQRRLPETLPSEENQILTVTKFSMASDQLLGIVLNIFSFQNSPWLPVWRRGDTEGFCTKTRWHFLKTWGHSSWACQHPEIQYSEDLEAPVQTWGVQLYFLLGKQFTQGRDTVPTATEKLGALGVLFASASPRHCFQPGHFYTARVVTAGGSPSRVPRGRPNLLCLGM